MIPYREVDVFGVYVSPVAVCAVAALVLTALLRFAADRLRLGGLVWHRPLFEIALFVCVLSLLVLRLGPA